MRLHESRWVAPLQTLGHIADCSFRWKIFFLIYKHENIHNQYDENRPNKKSCKQRKTKKNLCCRKFSLSQRILLMIFSSQTTKQNLILSHLERSYSYKMYNKGSFEKRALEGSDSQLLFLDNTSWPRPHSLTLLGSREYKLTTPTTKTLINFKSSNPTFVKNKKNPNPCYGLQWWPS